MERVLIGRHVDPAFYQIVREALIGLHEGDTRVIEVGLQIDQNLLDEDLWVVQLFLTPPTGLTWHTDITWPLKHAARDLMSDLTRIHNQVLEAQPIIEARSLEPCKLDFQNEPPPAPGESILSRYHRSFNHADDVEPDEEADE
jgi:hypothetical protein